MLISEFLIGSKDVISHEDHWCQNISSKTIDGSSICYADSEAYSFCSLGAIAKFCLSIGYNFLEDDFKLVARATDYLSRMSRAIDGTQGYITFNDTHSHSEVMELWDEAIALALKDESSPGGDNQKGG